MPADSECVNFTVAADGTKSGVPLIVFSRLAEKEGADRHNRKELNKTVMINKGRAGHRMTI